MGNIKVLDALTIDQIAAGEVVERPASVVKELVENALDADAKTIVVELRDAGRELVRVTDDGCGMDEDDAELAFERHATSKIRTVGDLDAVRTMGFRGEALASIAAVARVELLTRHASRDVGTMVTVHGGARVSVKRAAREPGTSVYVRDLFYNVPARRKFARSARVEIAHASDAVGRAAISRPDVSFTFIADGRELFRTRGDGDALGAVAAVLGRERAREMLPVKMERARMRVDGFVARPSLTRSTASHQLFFANGRPVSSALLAEAVSDGYAGLVMKGRHPVVVLGVWMPPGALDVNVHPTKREVRFRDDVAVYELVRDAVRAALSAANLVPEPMARGRGALASAPSAPTTGADGQTGASGAGRGERAGTSAVQSSLDVEAGGDGLALAGAPSNAGGRDIAADVAEGADRPLPKDARPVGQILDTYIVVEHHGGLILVDQHAAHERVVFETLKRSRSGDVAVQTLLTPLTVELGAARLELLRGFLPLLDEVGFDVEPFGGGAVLVRALPVVAGELESAERLHELLDDLARIGRAKTLDARRDELLHRVACHAAIRAGEPLSAERMTLLLAEMRRLDMPYTCPHGRPVAISLSREDLERLFGRSG